MFRTNKAAFFWTEMEESALKKAIVPSNGKGMTSVLWNDFH